MRATFVWPSEKQGCTAAFLDYSWVHFQMYQRQLAICFSKIDDELTRKTLNWHRLWWIWYVLDRSHSKHEENSSTTIHSMYSAAVPYMIPHSNAISTLKSIYICHFRAFETEGTGPIALSWSDICYFDCFHCSIVTAIGWGYGPPKQLP